jgi:Undecaprenyl-phosphate glucose phosphotransferase
MLIVAADVLAVALAGIASHLVWGGDLVLPPQYWGHILIACTIFVLVMQAAGMYQFAALRRHRGHLAHLTGLWAAVVLLLMAINYLTRRGDEYSRVWMLLWALGGWGALVATRHLAWRGIRRLRGQLVTRVMIFGHPLAAQRCAQELQRESGGEVEVIGIFEPKYRLGARDGCDIGALAQLGAADARTDEIILALPCGDILDLDAALGSLGPRVVDVKVGFDFGTSRRGGPLVLTPIWRRPLAGLPTVVKRAIDVWGSGALLLLSVPLMTIIAVLIKLDSPGPVLFRQQRFGIGKKPFTLYKFRSMRWEPDDDDPSEPQARRHDPRITRLGRFLRCTSLDELPQLLNVLRGDMALVGPRPHPATLDNKYAALIEGYVARHHVKPGITGWAQVNGWRGETDTLEKMERRIEHDIYYIRHWSLLLDLRILLKTLMVVWGQRNAY